MSVVKHNADVTAPIGSSVGVSPDANQNTMIAIGFAEVEVYGKNGASWVLVGTITAEDKVVFIPFETYSEVFFKSNTGSVEVVRVFFIEDSIVQAAAPTPTTVDEIGDMPSFTSADAGKVLSIDANGDLVWITR
jgi:hypothetical protein